MAINENTAYQNEHTCYVAMSGYGKSQALKANRSIPSGGARVLLWDCDRDHSKGGHYFNQWGEFVAAVKAAIRSGRGFRIGWAGDNSIELFERWCGIAWAILDGKKRTFLIIEELADVSPSTGKASPMWGQLNRRARKYGGIIHWTTQRSQEVSKTAWDQAAIKYIGFPNDGSKPDHLARLAGVAEADLMALKPLEFYKRQNGKTEKVRIQWRA